MRSIKEIANIKSKYTGDSRRPLINDKTKYNKIENKYLIAPKSSRSVCVRMFVCVSSFKCYLGISVVGAALHP